MATCYDCIHRGACADAGDSGYSCLIEDVSKCKHFKNKADFVEVVRCGKCKYRTEVTECNHTLYFCRKKQNYIKTTDFCSYGKRRDAE